MKKTCGTLRKQDSYSEPILGNLEKALDVQNLTVKYCDDVIGIRNFSLCQNASDGIVLAGPIGSGKSSILKAIAGLVKYEGEIVFLGQNLSKVAIRDRNFVYASFDSPLFERRTARYNLSYGLLLRSEPREKIAARTDEISAFFGVEHLLDKKIKSLSEFDRRKIIIARGFVRDADLYLFNDLTLGLCDDEAAFINKKISQQLAAKNVATMLSTSDYTQITDFGYRIVLIRQGEAVAEGDVEYFKNSPPSVFAALFTHGNLLVKNGKQTNNLVTFDGKTIKVEERDNLEREVLIIAHQDDNKYFVFCNKTHQLLYVSKKE